MSADSERKDEPESKVALRESEERFRLLIDSLQDYSVFPLSVEGRVSNWNLGAERLKGFSTQEAIGLHTQEALKARDEFLSMASHDLHSPLTSLRLQLQAVRRELHPGDEGSRVPEKLVSRLESMERQTDRMLRMMDALLDINQMTAGRLELKPQKLDLVELVRGSVGMLDEELRQSGMQIRVHAARADRRQPAVQRREVRQGPAGGADGVHGRHHGEARGA